jgi:hypothetical protein
VTPDPGPFAQSSLTPTTTERLVASLIWAHRRPIPITIAHIIAACKTTYGETVSERTVKGIVEQLRVSHRCPIGASREAPAGYFWIRTAADRETAVRPYREQILSMWRTLRVLDSPSALRELHGQLRLEAE